MSTDDAAAVRIQAAARGRHSRRYADQMNEQALQQWISWHLACNQFAEARELGWEGDEQAVKARNRLRARAALRVAVRMQAVVRRRQARALVDARRDERSVELQGVREMARVREQLERPPAQLVARFADGTLDLARFCAPIRARALRTAAACEQLERAARSAAGERVPGAAARGGGGEAAAGLSELETNERIDALHHAGAQARWLAEAASEDAAELWRLLLTTRRQDAGTRAGACELHMRAALRVHTGRASWRWFTLRRALVAHGYLRPPAAPAMPAAHGGGGSGSGAGAGAGAGAAPGPGGLGTPRGVSALAARPRGMGTPSRTPAARRAAAAATLGGTRAAADSEPANWRAVRDDLRARLHLGALREVATAAAARSAEGGAEGGGAAGGAAREPTPRAQLARLGALLHACGGDDAIAEALSVHSQAPAPPPTAAAAAGGGGGYGGGGGSGGGGEGEGMQRGGPGAVRRQPSGGTALGGHALQRARRIAELHATRAESWRARVAVGLARWCRALDDAHSQLLRLQGALKGGRAGGVLAGSVVRSARASDARALPAPPARAATVVGIARPSALALRRGSAPAGGAPGGGGYGGRDGGEYADEGSAVSERRLSGSSERSAGGRAPTRTLEELQLQQQRLEASALRAAAGLRLGGAGGVKPLSLAIAASARSKPGSSAPSVSAASAPPSASYFYASHRGPGDGLPGAHEGAGGGAGGGGTALIALGGSDGGAHGWPLSSGPSSSGSHADGWDAEGGVYTHEPSVAAVSYAAAARWRATSTRAAQRSWRRPGGAAVARALSLLVDEGASLEAKLEAVAEVEAAEDDAQTDGVLRALAPPPTPPRAVPLHAAGWVASGKGGGGKGGGGAARAVVRAGGEAGTLVPYQYGRAPPPAPMPHAQALQWAHEALGCAQDTRRALEAEHAARARLSMRADGLEAAAGAMHVASLEGAIALGAELFAALDARARELSTASAQTTASATQRALLDAYTMVADVLFATQARKRMMTERAAALRAVERCEATRARLARLGRSEVPHVKLVRGQQAEVEAELGRERARAHSLKGRIDGLTTSARALIDVELFPEVVDLLELGLAAGATEPAVVRPPSARASPRGGGGGSGGGGMPLPPHAATSTLDAQPQQQHENGPEPSGYAPYGPYYQYSAYGPGRRTHGTGLAARGATTRAVEAVGEDGGGENVGPRTETFPVHAPRPSHRARAR